MRASNCGASPQAPGERTRRVVVARLRAAASGEVGEQSLGFLRVPGVPGGVGKRLGEVVGGERPAGHEHVHLARRAAGRHAPHRRARHLGQFSVGARRVLPVGAEQHELGAGAGEVAGHAGERARELGGQGAFAHAHHRVGAGFGALGAGVTAGEAGEEGEDIGAHGGSVRGAGRGVWGQVEV